MFATVIYYQMRSFMNELWKDVEQSCDIIYCAIPVRDLNVSPLRRAAVLAKKTTRHFPNMKQQCS